MWGESAQKALLDPSVKQELAKLGYPETAEGYAKAMTRIGIGKGIVSLDIDKGSIKLDAEYLKNIKSAIPADKISSSIEPLVEDIKAPSVTLEKFDFSAIQQQMDTPEGKLRELLRPYAGSVKGLDDFINREGGTEKLLKMPVRDLYGIEQGYRPVQFDRLYEGLKGITGDARLDSNDTLEDVLKEIESKKIFHGTAEEIFKGEIPPHLEVNLSHHISTVVDYIKDDTTLKAATRFAKVDLSKLEGVKEVEAIMELPKVKIGGLVQGLTASKVFTEEEFNSAIKKIGGMNKFLSSTFSELSGKDQLFKKFAVEAYRVNGANDIFFNKRTVEEAMKGIYYKQIFKELYLRDK
ncbi:MAG: hypothetical protein HY228_02330 [Candidatus Yonathbacteria bacterium]|nr:hypothetical protein [Candidatus Yonathbacteria bacterium]